MNDVNLFTSTGPIHPAVDGPFVIGNLLHETAICNIATARLVSGWTLEITAKTMTEAEERDYISMWLPLFAAKAKCINIICSVPLNIVPTILPQLEEMVDYEVRMSEVREEHEGNRITGPAERWISLPLLT